MDACTFLEVFHSKGPWVLTAITVNHRGIKTETFGPKNKAAARNWISKYEGKQNLYFSVNLPRTQVKKKTNREDIEYLAYLHVDVDARAGEPPAKEFERIKLLLTDNCPVPPPTFVVFSGGGYQAFWQLREPVQVRGDLEVAEDLARYNKQLEIILGGDSCHNVDRIMRLPGTTNLPDAKKAAKGRTPTLAEVHAYSPDATYTLEDFTQAPPLQTPDTDPNLVAINTGNVQRLSADMHELDPYNVPDRVRVIIVQGFDPDTPKEGDNSRSAWLFDVCCQLVRCEVPDEIIYSILTDPDFGISASVRDKGNNGDRYAKRQIQRAKEEVEEPWLRKLNERFFIVGNYGGRCVVAEEYHERAKEYASYGVQRRDDFCARFKYAHVQVGKKSEPVGRWWLAHPLTRRYERIVFEPGREVTDGSYNLWCGFAVEPRSDEDCSLFLDHVHENVAGEYSEWLLNWMARAVQRPGEQAEVAVVLRGERGVGKSFFARQFGALFGPHFLSIANARHLTGNFNSHLEGCIVLLADEAFYAGNKSHASVLKALITDPTLAIERKGYDLLQTRNHLHIIMCSNDAWVVPAGLDERRFLVLDVVPNRRRDTEYFGRIENQMLNGGREALLYFLQRHDLTGWDFRQAPDTCTLTDQKLRSLSPTCRCIYEALCNGSHQGSKSDGEQVFVVTKLWAQELGVTEHSLGRELRAFTDTQDRLRLNDDDDRRRRGFWLPPLVLARTRWAEAYGLNGVQWPQDVLEWEAVEVSDDPPF